MNMAGVPGDFAAGALTTVTGGGAPAGSGGGATGAGTLGAGAAEPAPPRDEMTRTSTGAVPCVSMSSFAAAVYERSMMRSPTNGPRSLMRTTTLRPLRRFVTSAYAGSGSVLCAAVIAYMS